MTSTIFPLVEIAEVFSGRPPRRAEADEPTTRAPVLTMRDVGLRISPRAVLEEAEVTGDPDPNRRLQVGDVVVTSRGRIRAAVAQEEHEGVLVGPNLMFVRIFTDFPAALLAAYLRHPEIEARLLGDTGGTGTPGLSLETLRNMSLRALTVPRASSLSALVEEAENYRLEVEAGARLLSEAAAEAVYDRLDPAGAQ